MARKDQISQVVKLGVEWCFVVFVQSPCQAGQIHADAEIEIKESHSQIFFLAWNKKQKQYRLLMLEQDPWQFDKNDLTLTLSILKTSEIGALPNSLDQLRSVHLLTFKEKLVAEGEKMAENKVQPEL